MRASEGGKADRRAEQDSSVAFQKWPQKWRYGVQERTRLAKKQSGATGQRITNEEDETSSDIEEILKEEK